MIVAIIKYSEGDACIIVFNNYFRESVLSIRMAKILGYNERAWLRQFIFARVN
jgi:hypothetical protein